MKMAITRDTGFYAVGSPLLIFVNGEKVLSLSEDESKTLEVAARDVVTAKLVSMKSDSYTVRAESQAIKITPNSNRAVQAGLFLFLKFFMPGRLAITEV
ncbi:hypothetical protein [Pseudolactococcus insecticola]|uniref:Uncharacterized protein n=1 Tax=Pseudolactococcus insecticola TaxID=2709158 RepID=A0A6A0B5S1_9LACT|nr:hypothetical protein [Lactococcus insecticola]GFH40582.1 hypothetical protein Hs20B_09800 [Lactococcus insecticola]